MPEIRVTRGNPTPEEEAAIKAAISKIWREDVAAAAKRSSEPAWVVSARASAVRTRIVDVHSEHAWSLSLRFDGGPVSFRRIGRGDSR